MNPREVFCPIDECPARGQIGKGNITIHSRKEQRYKCNVCDKTFSARKSTVFHRRRISEEIITLILTLIAHGCPIGAIVVAFGYQARSVREWIEAAGKHCQLLHQHLVEKPRDLGQVQADELNAKIQRGKLWMAMAIMVTTRLWLGGVISEHRNKKLLDHLAAIIRRCALPLPLLLVTDGLKTYVGCFRRAFRSAIENGKVGRNQLVVWNTLVVAQIVKNYQLQGKRFICKGVKVCRLAIGTFAQLTALLKLTQYTTLLNTAYIERLNATFRSRLAALGRRTRSLLRLKQRMESGMYLVGTVYNFCCYHASLILENSIPQTPAMAAGITDHCWSMRELLEYRIPPEPWQPPKKRGKKSRQMQEIIKKWCENDHV
jgi:transposase-like protein